jgi:hypothetical protein
VKEGLDFKLAHAAAERTAKRPRPPKVERSQRVSGGFRENVHQQEYEFVLHRAKLL